MIIQNGTIEVQTTTGGGLNPSTGFPVAPSEAWGTPVPCQYSPVKYNALALSNGEPVTERNYTILIESQVSFAPDRVRLKNLAGTVIGEFSVQSIVPLDAVDQMEITV